MNKKLLKIKQELENVLFKLEDPDYAEIIYSEKDNSPKFTVCAEVGYTRLEEICEALDKVIQKYDDGAYFEPDVPGRADCYLWNFNLEDGYYDEDDEDDSEEISNIDNFFCVTLNNMSKEDAKFYGKTFGLFIRPNRRKGYDLAGDEDQVRAMLEDYVGRYDEIGKIMNEGNYIPDYCRGDFVNPHKRYADSKKVKDADEPMYYGLFQRGGSIGQNANAEYRRYGDGILLEVYLDKEEAKADAKRYRKNLTPGERSYYGMGYTVKPLNKSDLKNSYVQEMINKLGKNIIKDGKKKVKDSTTPIEDLLIKTDSKSGITLDHAIDDLKKKKGYNDSLLGDNLAINTLMKRFNLEKRDVIRVLNYKFDRRYLKDKKVKDSDPWHELAHYVLTFEDGHKETDTLPIYVKEQCSSDEEIIDMLQDYYDDKIVAVKQVGWSRMGDSKKKVKDEYYQEFVNKVLYATDHFKKGITVRNQKEFDNARAVCESNGVGAEYNPKTGYVKFIYKTRDSKKKVRDSVQEPVSEGAKEALEEYTEWYDIIGYDEDIVEVYESGCAFVDDEFIDYEDSYDALDAYLTWEGILGYTSAIYDILKNGVESVYYDGMLTDKESFEED